MQQGPQDFRRKRLPIASHRLKQAPVLFAVRIEGGRRILETAIEHGWWRVVERVRQSQTRLDPLKPMTGQRQRAKQRRTYRHRMYSGPDVMYQLVHSQFNGASAATDRR